MDATMSEEFMEEGRGLYTLCTQILKRLRSSISTGFEDVDRSVLAQATPREDIYLVA
ncbi:hypothetical protein HPP92_028953 [Vanilla planifolia]|uniref:Uncharacterized protein n=1 Tax=Vanilla planifolia TaxID=51239 RepID=A0A835P5G0_VANPL|nr:hypothetical protein HPP92_028943 [Vanilla planifolia]KAG0446211.1 hypothetical protein HPP92_028953 [Vanilla planifolia]